jgi:hypothetical protein
MANSTYDKESLSGTSAIEWHTLKGGEQVEKICKI